MAAAASSKVYSLADLRAHSTEADCWILVHGKVYDVTPFLDEHPGGFDIIVSNTGEDVWGGRKSAWEAAGRGADARLRVFWGCHRFPAPRHPSACCQWPGRWLRLRSVRWRREPAQAGPVFRVAGLRALPNRASNE